MSDTEQTDSGFTEMDLLTYAKVFLEHWWVIAPLAVLGAVAGLIYSHFLPPRYRARCRFEIFRNEMLMIGESPEMRYRRWDFNPAQRHRMLLNSSNLNKTVRQQLSKTWTIPETGSGFNLRVSPASEDNDTMLDITVDSFDAQYSLEYLKLLLAAYQKSRMRESETMHQETIRNLEREKNKRKEELQKVRREIVDFEREHHVEYEKQKRDSDRAHLNTMLQKHRQIQTQLSILNEQLETLKDADPAILGDILDLSVFASSGGNSDGRWSRGASWSEDPRWRDAVTRKETLELELEDMKRIYKPRHPKYQKHLKDLETAKRRLHSYADLARKRLESRRDALKMQEATILKAADEIRKVVDVSSAEEAQFASLKSQEQHLKDLHDKAYQRILDSSTVNPDKYFSRVIDGPFKGGAPVYPNKMRFVGMGTGGGMALGCLIVFLLFLRRSRMYNFKSIEVGQSIPCLADIPQISAEEVRGRPLFVNNLAKTSPVCEVYRSLRTLLDQRLGGNQILLVTSPSESDGKTFNCLNLANVYAWHRGKVLLVDGDFRRASLRNAFPEAPERGLVDCLKDLSLTWTDCVMSGVAENLDYLPAGKTGEHAAELLGGDRFNEILAEMKTKYRMIIVDSAPVSKVVDTILLGEHAEATLIVAQPGNSTPDAIRFALGRLTSANVVGFILNGLTPSSRKYTSYGHADYGYSYAKSYYTQDIYE